MRFIALFETARRNCVCENKKSFLGPEISVKPFDEKIVLVVEHSLKASAADVTIRWSIDRIVEGHVGRRHGFGYRAGCAADAKESARYFLAGAALGKGPVFGWVYIEREDLFAVGDLHLWIHR